MILTLILFLGGFSIVYFIVKTNNRYWEKQKSFWEPHCALVGGKIEKKYNWLGQANGIPLHWRIYSTGGGASDTSSKESYYFEMYLQCPHDVQKWDMYYNIPGLLNHRPEGWTINVNDNSLRDALDRAGIKEIAATLPRTSSMRYNGKKGRLTCEFSVSGMGYVQPLENFVSMIKTLEGMRAASQQSL